MDYKTIGIVMLVIAIAISAFLEWLKLVSKKNGGLRTWVQISIPAVLSLVLSWVAWSAFTLPGKAQVIILYALLVFLTQYYLSMEILKRVGKVLAKFLMRLKGMNDQEIQEALGG